MRTQNFNYQLCSENSSLLKVWNLSLDSRGLGYVTAQGLHCQIRRALAAEASNPMDQNGVEGERPR